MGIHTSFPVRPANPFSYKNGAPMKFSFCSSISPMSPSSLLGVSSSSSFSGRSHWTCFRIASSVLNVALSLKYLFTTVTPRLPIAALQLVTLANAYAHHQSLVTSGYRLRINAHWCEQGIPDSDFFRYVGVNLGPDHFDHNISVEGWLPWVYVIRDASNQLWHKLQVEIFQVTACNFAFLPHFLGLGWWVFVSHLHIGLT